MTVSLHKPPALTRKPGRYAVVSRSTLVSFRIGYAHDILDAFAALDALEGHETFGEEFAVVMGTAPAEPMPAERLLPVVVL